MIPVALVCALLLMLGACSTQRTAEPQRSASGDLVRNFTDLYVQALNILWLHEVCARTYPRYAGPNKIALTQWRYRYNGFLRELEAHFHRIAWVQAGRDEVRAVQLEARMAETLRAQRDLLERGVRKGSRQRSEALCRTYAFYLTTPKADIERSNPERVATLRRAGRYWQASSPRDRASRAP